MTRNKKLVNKNVNLSEKRRKNVNLSDKNSQHSEVTNS